LIEQFFKLTAAKEVDESNAGSVKRRSRDLITATLHLKSHAAADNGLNSIV